MFQGPVNYRITEDKEHKNENKLNSQQIKFTTSGEINELWVYVH